MGGVGPAAKPRRCIRLGFHGAEGGSLTEADSLTETEPTNQRLVTLVVNALQVIELATTLADELQETAARVVVLAVGLEVPGQLRDALREDCDLHLGRTRVCLMGSVLSDDFGFFDRVKHCVSSDA